MMNANTARKNTCLAIDHTMKSTRFRYAIKKIEDNIREASMNGYDNIKWNVTFMTDRDDYPEIDLRNAVKEELVKNGYSYHEYDNVALNGRINRCFEVSW